MRKEELNVSRRGPGLKGWVVATRPWSFPASVMPVVVALAYLFSTGVEVNWVNGIWAVVNIVLFHAAGNVWSDWFDYRRGVDAEGAYCVRTLIDGVFRPAQMLRLAIGLLVVATVAGCGLMMRTGIELLWVGIGGLLCTLLYPMLKYRALGDVVIAVAYAWLPMWGTSFVASGHVDFRVFMLAVPVGMITVAILHVNNTRDISTDRRAGIVTLAMKLGRKASAGLYAFWIAGAFAFVGACVALGLLPVWSLLILLCLPQGVSHVRCMLMSRSDGETTAIAGLDELTAKLQLQFSLLLALSFVIAGVA